MQPPIDSLPFFPALNEKLIAFLRQLPAEAWHQQTVARKWVVKDVATHLLDGNFRRIALNRDGWSLPPDREITAWQSLVDYLNQLNADWVKATKRLSPQILVQLLESTNAEVHQIFRGLDPFASSAYPVGWAGESVSFNWFDIAREYTERFLHQQQIRDAVGDESLLDDQLYHHFLYIFMQAWPYTCRDLDAKDNSLLKASVPGKGGGTWFLHRENGKWKLGDSPHGELLAETIIDRSVAWKLFSKSVRRENIEGHYEIKGDRQAGTKLLEMVSVMA